MSCAMKPNCVMVIFMKSYHVMESELLVFYNYKPEGVLTWKLWMEVSHYFLIIFTRVLLAIIFYYIKWDYHADSILIKNSS